MLHHQEMMPSPEIFVVNTIKTLRPISQHFTLLYSFSVSRVLELILNFSWFCKGSALLEQVNESLLRMRMKVSKAQRPEGKSIEG